MVHRARAVAGIVAGLWMTLGTGATLRAQARAPGPGTAPPSAAHPSTAHQPPTMPTHASGTFDVQLKPLSPYEDAEGALLGRLSIDKQFHGDLDAVSKGEMLSAGTLVQGSAGYVAIERVRGTLHGRRGTFVLQHSGTMTRGAPSLTVTVVPDSGTGELTGLAGTLTITIAGGVHSYDFAYTLAGAPAGGA